MTTRRQSWALLSAAAALFSTACLAHGQDGLEVVPGTPAATATLRCIGIMWPVEGDSNGSASCEVAYRKAGTDRWRPALPLHRKPFDEVDVEKSTAGARRIAFLGGISKWGEGTGEYALVRWKANYLAGSIFNLEPATAYEVRLSLSDADGAVTVEKLLKVATRAAPVIPRGGRTVEVRAADGPGALARALSTAEAGMVIRVHEGTYAGPVKITASGTPEAPIVVTAAGDARAIVEGEGLDDRNGSAFEITGSNIHLNGLEIRKAWIGVKLSAGRLVDGTAWDFENHPPGSPSGVAVTRCRIREVRHAIAGHGENCYVADNELAGTSKSTVDYNQMDGEGVEIMGSANVIAYNRITFFADGISVYPNSSDQDVYNNDITQCSDDSIELDYCDHNNRLWNNRFNFARHNGISLQPHIGGPAYIIRNQLTGFDESCIKDRYGSSDVFLFHNTFVGGRPITYSGKQISRQPTMLPWRVVSRNNIYIVDGGTDSPVIEFEPEELEAPTFDLDYDGVGGPIQVTHARGLALEEKLPGSQMSAGWGGRLFVPAGVFAEKFGVLKHRVMADPATLFEVPPVPFRYWYEDGPTPVMRLKAGSAAIDAGVVIPNVNEDFAGRAPDLGALEFGAAEPHWGVRPAGTAPYER